MGERSYFATKTNANFSDNPRRWGLPTILGTIVLADAANGTPLAIMDSGSVTALRTGAATAVAAKFLARPDARTATIVGCGVQGELQLAAITAVLPLRHIMLLVRRSVSRFGTGPTKTVESKRTVQMLAIVERALRGQRAASPVRSPWVFSNRDGGPLDITNLRERVWRPALRRAKLRARTLYQTRHTFATLMLELGESPGVGSNATGAHQCRDGLSPIPPLHSEPTWAGRGACGERARGRGTVTAAVVTGWSLDAAKGLREDP